ncbi:hypothetical protein PF005_g25233 [Phytophthora fragariae]|uniref:RxLR effector protein n=1 Tax=Phytophthora fragariae TaxID=53985 RepID=A0A6A3W9N9_9STRA|nr:hypothetical protein PF009_g24954 [Phytophthora fragariae]KAE9088437.1 hypothetical protein PF010_g19380 [Phytophthora fragariae]KAE9175819.1 hypothetical protein PF005_g25233 [Phytophthora fragariae]KAE9200851.1 hypothetical protein PF004_g18883 [Phytophthora fragariae]
MHLQGLVGLLILGLTRRIDADLATGSPPLVSDFDTASETSTSATKFLRTSGVNDNDEGDGTEERVGLSAVDKLKNLFSSSTVSSQQLETWLDKGKSADTVFARMRLTDAGEGLLSGSSTPKSWVLEIPQRKRQRSQH